MLDINEINEQTKLHYNKVAVKYVEFVKDEVKNKEYDRNLLNNFAETLGKNAYVCDVGCGAAGHIGRHIFDKGLKTCGIDISEESIKSAKELNPEMDFSVMDMTKLDFADNSLDGIIAFYSIIHIPKNDIAVVFNEFKRVLKIGGKILLAVHKGDTEEIIGEAMGEKTSLFLSKFSEGEIISYMTQNGFGIKFIETRDPYPFEFQTQRIYTLGIKTHP